MDGQVTNYDDFRARFNGDRDQEVLDLPELDIKTAGADMDKLKKKREKLIAELEECDKDILELKNKIELELLRIERDIEKRSEKQ